MQYVFFQVDGIYVKDLYNNFVSIFFLVFFQTRQFLLEYCSLQSRFLSIVSTFSFKIFASFFTSKILLPFSFLSASISSNFSLLNFFNSLNPSMCLLPSISASFAEEESSQIYFTFFPQILQVVIKYQHNVGILFPPTKISFSSLQSGTFKLLSPAFFLSSSPFDLWLKSRFCLSKKLLI